VTIELAEELDDETDGNSLSEEIKKLGYDSPIRQAAEKFTEEARQAKALLETRKKDSSVSKPKFDDYVAEISRLATAHFPSSLKGSAPYKFLAAYPLIRSAWNKTLAHEFHMGNQIGGKENKLTSAELRKRHSSLFLVTLKNLGLLSRKSDRKTVLGNLVRDFFTYQEQCKTDGSKALGTKLIPLKVFNDLFGPVLREYPPRDPKYDINMELFELALLYRENKFLLGDSDSIAEAQNYAAYISTMFDEEGIRKAYTLLKKQVVQALSEKKSLDLSSIHGARSYLQSFILALGSNTPQTIREDAFNTIQGWYNDPLKSLGKDHLEINRGKTPQPWDCEVLPVLEAREALLPETFNREHLEEIADRILEGFPNSLSVALDKIRKYAKLCIKDDKQQDSYVLKFIVPRFIAKLDSTLESGDIDNVKKSFESLFELERDTKVSREPISVFNNVHLVDDATREEYYDQISYRICLASYRGFFGDGEAADQFTLMLESKLANSLLTPAQRVEWLKENTEHASALKDTRVSLKESFSLVSFVAKELAGLVDIASKEDKDAVVSIGDISAGKVRGKLIIVFHRAIYEGKEKEKPVTGVVVEFNGSAIDDHKNVSFHSIEGYRIGLKSGSHTSLPVINEVLLHQYNRILDADSVGYNFQSADKTPGLA